MNNNNNNNNIKYSFYSIKQSITNNIQIVAVSKNRSIDCINTLYKIGHRDFGENYVQEMVLKYNQLPKNIRWHMIGKIQTNKLKYISPFIYMIHSVYTLKQLHIINNEAKKHNRIIKCLLQVKICNDKTKSGILNDTEIYHILDYHNNKKMKYVKIIGLMGMSSHYGTDDQIQNEFNFLKKIYKKCKYKYNHSVLSMGMSRDYIIAIKCGSNMIRLGTSIFDK
ncbi:YggS family pyridoxal phosphate-dependent enzyme [Blattabacterium cuenoti]|uniref:YggS family pyridoxal phosphate-dependent enzyme n=1 Tax=Blattabacterium cuenoti TaxID=1653831 RepID=UPI00163C464A|nr:YggS family pyridoxal phosphate-dependent enzyme [Blattabacterium cuenoti]